MTYWVEHGLLLSIPFYLLLSRGSPYTVASNTELASWTSLSYGAWGFYHYLFLQPLALISLGNLNRYFWHTLNGFISEINKS